MRRTRTKKFKYSFLLKHWIYVMASVLLVICFYLGVYKYEHEQQSIQEKKEISLLNNSNVLF